jgi:hypothetical protein
MRATTVLLLPILLWALASADVCCDAGACALETVGCVNVMSNFLSCDPNPCAALEVDTFFQPEPVPPRTWNNGQQAGWVIMMIAIVLLVVGAMLLVTKLFRDQLSKS